MVARRPARAVPSIADLRAVALEAARAGGEKALEGFGGRISAERKSDGSPVTVFDRASEAAIRREIQGRWPDHRILGEEAGETGTDPRVRWVVDPIDGTKSFVRGVPLFSVLIGVEIDGRAVVGVIHLPALRETIDGAEGLGSRWDGRPAHVSKVGSLADAMLLTTSVRGIEQRGVPFRRIWQATGSQRGWSDGYGYALVATGRADVMIDAGMSAWDAAPMVPILAEAGGRFTDWTGATTIHGGDGVGTNGRLHPAVLRLLRRPPRRA